MPTICALPFGVSSCNSDSLPCKSFSTIVMQRAIVLKSPCCSKSANLFVACTINNLICGLYSLRTNVERNKYLYCISYAQTICIAYIYRFIFLKHMPHQRTALLACLCILIGMFVSRAMMSIGMMTLFGNALLHAHFKTNLKSFLKQPLLLMLSGYFILFSISILWSENIVYFLNECKLCYRFCTAFCISLCAIPKSKILRCTCLHSF